MVAYAPMNNETYWGHTSYPSTTCGECPLSATHNGKDGRATRGDVDDYWIDYGSGAQDPYITNGWAEHAAAGSGTGYFMGTNQSKYGNTDGSTTFYCYTDGTALSDYSGCEPGAQGWMPWIEAICRSEGIRGD